MRALPETLLPAPVGKAFQDGKKRLVRLASRVLNRCGLNVARMSDYHSPLPVMSDLEKNARRWTKPSGLVGVRYDIQAMKSLLTDLVSKYSAEYAAMPTYYENARRGYGPGYTALDAMVLYFMIRDIKPRRYVEVGSGLSTYYAFLAAQQNAKEGRPLKITCIEPYPYEALLAIPDIEIFQKEVQDVQLSAFEQLDAGDILFVDSSHIVRIDGDVPYLHLEVIPRLKKGSIVHVHDVPFPYNIPYPPELWVLGAKWPVFWNEAMLLQAFLCYNDVYTILLSTPLLRFHEEDFLRSIVRNYEPVSQSPNTFSSIWIERTG